MSLLKRATCWGQVGAESSVHGVGRGFPFAIRHRGSKFSLYVDFIRNTWLALVVKVLVFARLGHPCSLMPMGHSQVQGIEVTCKGE